MDPGPYSLPHCPSRMSAAPWEGVKLWARQCPSHSAEDNSLGRTASVTHFPAVRKDASVLGVTWAHTWAHITASAAPSRMGGRLSSFKEPQRPPMWGTEGGGEG